jgi:hypothetical protein
MGGDSGRAEDVRRSPRLKLVASDAGAEDSARPEALVDAVPQPVASLTTGSTPVEEAAPVGANLSPPPAPDDAAAGNAAVICTSPGLPSQGNTREAAIGETETAFSNLELVPSVQAMVPTAESGAGAIADSLLLGLASSSGEASPRLLAT